MDCATQAITILDFAFRISSQIYTYTKDVKEARRDIDALSNELFALIGVIERLRHSDGHGDAKINTLHSQPEFLRVMNETLEFLQNLHATLETPQARLDKMLQKMKWPLKGEETKRHLERLERVKTYFLLSIMTNDLCVISGKRECAGADVVVCREQTKNIAKQIESLRSEMAERENEAQRCKHPDLSFKRT
jgi:chromosome segregation ATPase